VAVREEILKHEEWASIPVVVITAHDRARLDASDLKAAAVLLKPYPCSGVIPTLARALGNQPSARSGPSARTAHRQGRGPCEDAAACRSAGTFAVIGGPCNPHDPIEEVQAMPHKASVLGKPLRCSLLIVCSCLVLAALAPRPVWAQAAEAQPPPTSPETLRETAPPPLETTGGIIAGRVVSEEVEAPVAGATVTVVGTGRSVQTDANGSFRLEVPPGTHTVRVQFSGFRPIERRISVAAGSTSTLEVPLLLDQLATESIVVVGSRTPRSQVETPVPVDLVSSEEISRSGQSETGRVLSGLAPSFNSSPQTVADGTDHIDPASLRGLGPDQVLVLVNGKRRHRSALLHVNQTFGRGTVGVDLNAIPSGAIKRIEILRDGAASLYGSDAIAGVINIVLKDVTDLLEVNTFTGVTGSGDVARLKTSANYGFKLGERGGFFNVTGEFLERTATSRSGAYTGTVYSEDRAVDDQMLAARGLSREQFAMKIGESAATVGMASYNMELPLAEFATFYSFGDLSHRFGRAAGFYRFPKQTAQVVPELYPDGFLPEIHPTIDDLALGVGLRGQTAGWDVDLSLTHGRNSVRFNIENSVNASLGSSSPTTFDAGSLGFSQSVGNLDLRRRIQGRWWRSLSFVLGTEFRVENYRIDAGDEPSYSLGPETVGTPPMPKVPGAQVFPGFQPNNEVDRFRNNVGAYAGLESQLHDRVFLDVGGRFENYSDFGRSLIGKAATRVEVLKGLALRGAASTGFRAPSLHQFWFNNVITSFVPNPATNMLEATQVLTSHNRAPVTKAFGIPELQEETSLNLSAGVVFRPLEKVAVTVDGYLIRIDDRIVLTSRFTNANVTVAQVLAPFPSVSQAQFFANAVDTETRGVDVVADYALALGNATLTLTGAANFTSTEVLAVKMPPSLVARFGADPSALETSFFGRGERNRLEDALPRQKGFAAARFTWRGLSALARANYFGSVVYKPDNPENDETFGAKTLFDVDLGYQPGRNFRLSVGAENLLNTFPDRQAKEANISFGRFVYSRYVSQFGQNGGFYYGRLQLFFL
jgi:iron complex outermembrane recepter protein